MVARGRWKRYLGWALVALVVVIIMLGATWRSWFPSAVKYGLGMRDIHVDRVVWEGTNQWRFEGVEYASGGLVARAKSITSLRREAWKQALAAADTNQTYFTVSGWRVILPPDGGNGGATNSFAKKIKQLDWILRQWQTISPRAVFLNGTVQAGEKNFNFATIQWSGGELSGDLTWPQLNDPADFKLKILEGEKTQFILRQTALEIGSRIVAENLRDGARLVGYARWKTNRADFDLGFSTNENIPRGGFIESKGLAIPGKFLGMPEIEMLNARTRLVITNGRFDFRVGQGFSEQN